MRLLAGVLLAVAAMILVSVDSARSDDLPPSEPRVALVFTPGGTHAEVRDPTLDSDAWTTLETAEPIIGGFTDPALNTALVYTARKAYMYDPRLDPSDRWNAVEDPSGQAFVFGTLSIGDPGAFIWGAVRTNNRAFFYDRSVDPDDAWVAVETTGTIIQLAVSGQTATVVSTTDVLFYDPRVDQDERVTQVSLDVNETVVGVSIDPETGTLTTLSTDQRVILYDRSLDPRSRTLEVPLEPNETVVSTTTRGNNAVTVTSDRIITFDGTLDPRDRQIDLPLDVNETVLSTTVTGRVNVFVTSDGRAILYDRTLDPRDRFSIAPIEGVDPATITTVAADGDDNVAIVTGTTAYVYDGSLDPRSRLQEVPLNANESVLGVSVMGNRFIWATDGRAIAYDGSKDPPFIEGDLPGGAFVATSGQGVAGVVATTGGVAIYDPGSGQWLTKDMDGVTGVIAADDIIIIQTDTGVSMYDRRFDPRSDPIEAPIGGDARFFAQRNTGMAFVPGEAVYYNVVDGKWYSVPPLQNDTWVNGAVGNRTAVVCGENAAAVWDPTLDPRSGWQVLNVGGDTVVSVTPSSRGFIVNTETSSYIYDRGQSKWIERDEPPNQTSSSGGRGTIDCTPKAPEEPEEEIEPEVEEPEVVDEGTDGGTDDFDEPPPLSTGDKHSIIIVVDASGSMADNGKIDQAKSAARGLLAGGLPEGNEVGLVIFYDCGAIEWTPFTEDYATLLPVIDGISPSGSTPIAESIAFAADKMETEGSGDDGRIIMLTDGGETCSGDPVQAASSVRQIEVGSRRSQNRELPSAESRLFVSRAPVGAAAVSAAPRAPQAQDGDVRLDVIGFQLDEATTTAMREVAKAGGGGYLPAENADDLSRAFARLTRTETATVGDATRTWGAAGGGLALFVVLAGLVLKVGPRRRAGEAAGPPTVSAPGPAGGPAEPTAAATVVTETPPVAAEAPPAPVVPETPPVTAEAPPAPVAPETPPVTAEAPPAPVLPETPPVAAEAPPAPVVPETPPVTAEAPPAPVLPETPPVTAEAPPAPVIPETPPVTAEAPPAPVLPETPPVTAEAPPAPVLPETPPVAAEAPPAPVIPETPPVAAEAPPAPVAPETPPPTPVVVGDQVVPAAAEVPPSTPAPPPPPEAPVEAPVEAPSGVAEEPPAPPAPTAPPRLLVVSGRSDALVTELTMRRTSIGADAENELSVVATGVAPFHAEVRREGTDYVLYAIGDAPVIVNGTPTRRHILSEGDNVDLGDARLVVRWPEHTAQGAV